MTEDKNYLLDELIVSDMLSYLGSRVSSMEEHIRREQKQLTKAKEIIKKLTSFPVRLCSCIHTVDFEKTREEAVQFLKEVK